MNKQRKLISDTQYIHPLFMFVGSCNLLGLTDPKKTLDENF